MFPVLFQIGSFQLHTYTALIDLGLLAALATLWRQAPPTKRGLWLDAGLAALTGGLAGARLLYALIHGNYYAAHPDEIVMVWRGGLAWPGAVVGAWLGASLYCSRKHERVMPLLDALAGPLLLLSLLSWGGCVAAGCAYGREVSAEATPAWLVWTAPDLYGLVVPRWPTALAGAGWSLLALIGFWSLRRRRTWPEGVPTATALGLTALGAVLLDLTRGDPMPLLSGVRLDLLASGLILVAAGAWGLRQATRTHLQATPSTQP